MKWHEFKALLVGIGPETPLGRIVQIRAEDDKEILKGFTKEQHSIRNSWRSRRAKDFSPEDMGAVLEQFKQIFLKMGGVGN